MTAAKKQHVHGARDVSLQSIAARMLAEADGDIGRAAEKFANYAESIPRIRGELLIAGAKSLLNQVPGAMRATILRERTSAAATPRQPYREPPAAKAARARMIGAGRNAIKSALMEMPYIIGGVSRPLREWTGGEITAHGEQQLATGASAVRNARYLIAVGTAAGAKKIGEALDGSEVERLHKQAMESAV